MKYTERTKSKEKHRVDSIMKFFNKLASKLAVAIGTP
jgi:hypothetical protein